MINSISRIFMGTAYLLERLFPNIKLKLKQAYISEDSITYLSKTVLYSTLIFLVVSTTVIFLFRLYHREETYLGLLLAFASFLFVFYYKMNVPNMMVKRRVNDIEKNLVFAIQALYIQVSSGVPVFDAMVSISNGRYGAISGEFRVTINEIKSGKPLINALNELAVRNPSMYFQKVIWQIINTIKTGGNLADNLSNITNALSRDQINVVKNYGGNLSPLSMAYMMVAVIVPSLGITVLITVSSLPSIGAKIDTSIFWGILAVTLILQAQFAMIINLKRPNLIGE